MERIRLLYEQIEEARRLMLSGTLPHLRLALILLDNAAELIMYRELSYRFSADDYYARLRNGMLDAGMEDPRKYSEEERRAAEREFTPMVKILQLRLKMISAKDAIVLRVCHEMRRDAFHRGEMNAAILLPVTQLLFLTVADLGTSFPVHSYSIPGGVPPKETADFLGRFEILPYSFGDENSRDKIYRTLVQGIAFNSRLSEILSSDLVERIDLTIEGLAYLNNDSSDRAKLDDNLRQTQFWGDRGAKVAQKAFDEGRLPKDDLDAAYSEWSKNPGPKFTMDKLERWRRQGAAIAKLRHPADALARYRAFEQLFAPLEEDVAESVAARDDEINLMVKNRR